MKLNHLIPWRRPAQPATTGSRTDDQFPLLALQRNMNQLFEDLFTGFDLEPFGAAGPTGFTPAVNVAETDTAVEITAELPGLDDQDIQLSVDADTLVLSGEKKARQETKDEHGWHRVERSYGSFHRQIPLPAEVLTDKAEAVFKQGVLHVTLPKKPEAQAKAKKFAVRREA